MPVGVVSPHDVNRGTVCRVDGNGEVVVEPLAAQKLGVRVFNMNVRRYPQSGNAVNRVCQVYKSIRPPIVIAHHDDVSNDSRAVVGKPALVSHVNLAVSQDRRALAVAKHDDGRGPVAVVPNS